VDRIDLDGNAAGVVTELEAVSAQKGVAAGLVKAMQKRKPNTVETPPPPPGKPAPRRDGLAALKQAAALRKTVAA
jgi:sRNA-binding protein